MDALRRSVAEDAKSDAATKTAASTGATPKKTKKRVPGQGELLMPIAGRKEPPKRNQSPLHSRPLDASPDSAAALALRGR